MDHVENIEQYFINAQFDGQFGFRNPVGRIELVGHARMPICAAHPTGAGSSKAEIAELS
jgi:hypothetical protein